jgi:hypothetical protein
MVHPVHGKDPDKQVHRTYKTLDPAGEIAVVQRPEGVLKVVVYTGSGEKQKEHFSITLDRQAAFDFAMEMLQQAYRVGEAP